eukprot:jgi/Ulvmu1/761/UM010_0135.1
MGRAPMCHFYRQGICNKGADCTFSHDLAHPDSFLCPYFLKGTCIYGEKCQYDHRMPIGATSPRSTGTAASASTGTAASSATATSSVSVNAPPFESKKNGSSAVGGKSSVPSSVSRPPAVQAECVYFKSGECRFGNKCRFRHGPAKADSEGVMASLENQMLNLNTGKRAPKSGGSTSKAGRNGGTTTGSAGNVAKESAWSSRKAREPVEAGLTVHDDNQDPNDPWFRSQNPSMIPERTQMPQVDNCEVLCVPYTMSGECPYGDSCVFMHGELCETCGSHCLHPRKEDVRNEHITACAEMLKATEAHARSKHKECGICLEAVLGKEDPAARRFGLLTCEHCFCLKCIRSWRGSTLADESATRACPSCRTTTFFVTPSSVWPQSAAEKQHIIDGYKAQLGRTHCKHYGRGSGTCPFGTSCFYRHENADGTLQERDALPADTRFASGADGRVMPLRDPTLSSFLQHGRVGRRLMQR